MSTAVIIFIVIVIGTYFFFSQLSIWLLKLMKKNRRFYLKGYHLLSISDLTYRVKDNARLFFIVSIVSAVAFTATGVLAVFKSNMTVENTEYEIEYLSLPENTTESDHIRLIEDSLSESGYDYTTQTFETIDTRYKSAEGLTPVLILSQEGLLKSFPHVEVEPLEDNVGIYFLDNRGSRSNADIPRFIKLVDSPNTIKVKRIEDSILSVSTALVVNDQTFEKIKKTLKTSTFHGFKYKNWKDSTEKIRVLESQIFGDYSHVDFYFLAKANVYFQTVQIPSLSLFIGLFVAIVFFFAAGSFLYFRLFTDLEEEREKYKALAKIGLTEKEMKRSATWQLGILFFLPFIVAAAHTAFAMKVVEREVLFDIFTPTIITIIGFLLLQTLFFIIVRISYFKKLTASIND
ncbi:FtsX-like permease family protein [Bacillus sp. FJAT-53060]